MSQLHTPIPVTVITGFLGSGKTTLLSKLLKQKEMAKTAVIINEFGDVGLDHAFIERPEENIVELQSGCICCTIRGDLSKTLIDLHQKMLKGEISQFDRIVIETTGLADPIPIIHTLITSVELHRIYILDAVITIVDAVNGAATLNNQPESVKQTALAECIVISKTDLADTKTQTELISHLKIINPSAKIIDNNHAELSYNELFAFKSYDPYDKSQDVKKWLAAEKYENQNEHEHHHHHHHHHDVNRHGKHIKAFAMTNDKPISSTAFTFFLDMLAAKAGENLLRVKGIVNIKDENRAAVIHGVQHIFHPVKWLDEWPDNDKRTRMVFITRDIPQEEVEDIFNILLSTVNSTSEESSNSFMQT